MVDALPSARFVAILREPVAGAHSHNWFARCKGKESLGGFAEAVAAGQSGWPRARMASRLPFRTCTTATTSDS